LLRQAQYKVALFALGIAVVEVLKKIRILQFLEALK